MKQDFLSHELNIGDYVIFITPYYKKMSYGRIEKLGKKQCTISFKNKWDETDKTYRRYDSVVKMADEDVFLKEL